MDTPMLPPNIDNLKLLKFWEERCHREFAEAIKSPDPIVRQEAQEAYDDARQKLAEANASIQKRLQDDKG